MRKINFILLAMLIFTAFGCENPNVNGNTPTDQPINFSNGIPDDWNVSGCEVDNTEGRGDNNSVRFSNNGSIVCSITGSESVDMVEFFIKGEGNISFYIDNKLINSFAGAESWFRCRAFISAGEHEIKWVASVAQNAPAAERGDTVSGGASGFFMDDVLFSVGNAPGKRLSDGSIVAFVAQNGGGLIVTTELCSQFYAWDNGIEDDINGAKATGYGAGKANTAAIIAKCGGGNYAANVAAGVTTGGFVGEWFLPSIDELECIRQNYHLIEGFVGYRYWSSTDTGYRISTPPGPTIQGWEAAQLCIGDLMCGNSPAISMRTNEYKILPTRYF